MKTPIFLRDMNQAVQEEITQELKKDYPKLYKQMMNGSDIKIGEYTRYSKW